MYFSGLGFFKRDRTIALLKDVGTTDVDSDMNNRRYCSDDTV